MQLSQDSHPGVSESQNLWHNDGPTTASKITHVTSLQPESNTKLLYSSFYNAAEKQELLELE